MIGMQDRIIVALDVPTLEEARSIVRLLKGHVGMFKAGLQLLNAVGTPIVLQMLVEEGVNVMADMKLNDTPNTMTGAVEAVVGKFHPALLTIHASSGPASIQAAVEAAGETRILGVTVLTSMTPEDCRLVFNREPGEQVVVLAKLLSAYGAPGAVCSPEELELLDNVPEARGLLRVIPGIRPSWTWAQDQKRVMTPGEAIAAGADYLVIGRPITKPPASMGDSIRAVRQIVLEMESVHGSRIPPDRL